MRRAGDHVDPSIDTSVRLPAVSIRYVVCCVPVTEEDRTADVRTALDVGHRRKAVIDCFEESAPSSSRRTMAAAL